jgi:hypothetical protein
MTPVQWDTIEPKDAIDILLPNPNVIGPVNELGEECPWPWDPQQLGGRPLGQYHCPYCGGMQMAGVPHLDWRDEPLPDPADPNSCKVEGREQ